jgi:hypothetical protein
MMGGIGEIEANVERWFWTGSRDAFQRHIDLLTIHLFLHK